MPGGGILFLVLAIPALPSRLVKESFDHNKSPSAVYILSNGSKGFSLYSWEEQAYMLVGLLP